MKEIKNAVLRDFASQKKELLKQRIFTPPPIMVLSGEKFLTVDEAVQRVHKTNVSILNWVHRGIGGCKLEAIRVKWHSNMYFVRESSLDYIIQKLSASDDIVLAQGSLMPIVHLILYGGEQNDSVLLMRSWSHIYETKMYGLVSGRVESGERFDYAMARIAAKRVHIVLNTETLRQTHSMQRNAHPGCLDIFFMLQEGATWLGSLQNKEPGRYDMKWMPLDVLPDNMLPHIRIALEYCKNGNPFSSYGWNTAERESPLLRK